MTNDWGNYQYNVFLKIFNHIFFSPHQSRELGISRIFAVNTKNCFIAVSIEDSINPIQNRCNPDRESFLTTEARTPPCPSFDTSISAVNPNKSVLVSLYVSQWPSTIILKIVLLKMWRSSRSRKESHNLLCMLLCHADPSLNTSYLEVILCDSQNHIFCQCVAEQWGRPREGL